MQSALSDDFISFTKSCPSFMHRISHVRGVLSRAKYNYIRSVDDVQSEFPQKGFICTNNDTIIAFNSNGSLSGLFMIPDPNQPIIEVISERPIEKSCRQVLTTGSLINPHAWCNRDLKFVGEVTENGKQRLFESDEVGIIPSMKTAYFEFEPSSPQSKYPIIGLTTSLADITGTGEASPIFAVDAQEAEVVGAGKEFFCGSGISTIASLYTSLKAFLKTPPSEGVTNFLVIPGRKFKQDDLLSLVEKITGEDRKTLFLANSLFVHVAGIKGFHPRFKDQSDEGHELSLGSGIAFANSGLTDITVRYVINHAASRLGIPVQQHARRNDDATQAAVPYITYSFENMGIAEASLGVSTLGHNSPRQTISVRDVEYMQRLLTELCEHFPEHVFRG